MSRIFTLLLLIGVLAGLVARQPANALGTARAPMTTMPQGVMASTSDCMGVMKKATRHLPCKCGVAGCAAMMTSGASMIAADDVGSFTAPLSSDRVERIGRSAALRGRSTVPEPEPPTTLI